LKDVLSAEEVTLFVINMSFSRKWLICSRISIALHSIVLDVLSLNRLILSESLCTAEDNVLTPDTISSNFATMSSLHCAGVDACCVNFVLATKSAMHRKFVRRSNGVQAESGTADVGGVAKCTRHILDPFALQGLMSCEKDERLLSIKC
jgi:hypothetical protein